MFFTFFFAIFGCSRLYISCTEADAVFSLSAMLLGRKSWNTFCLTSFVEFMLDKVPTYPALFIILDHLNATHNFLFFRSALASTFLRRIPIPLDSRLHPIASFHTLPLMVIISLQTKPSKQRTVNSLQVKIMRRPQEIQQTQAIQMRLIRGRCYDTMHTGLQVPVRPELQHVGDVHCNRAGVGFDPFPTTIWSQNLQSRDRLSEE